MAKEKTFSSLRNERKRRPLSMKIVFAIAFILFAIYTLYVLFFFVFGLILSLKPNMNSNIYSYADPLFWTKQEKTATLFSIGSNNFHFENFYIALSSFTVTTSSGTSSYLQMVLNSFWRTTLATFINWFCTATVCYVLVHYPNKLTKFIYVLGLFLSMIPLYGAGGAEYRLFQQLNFIDNPIIYITQISLFGGNWFYMYAFWKAISPEYKEAGLIDGSSHFGIYFKIMLPMVLPSIVALFVMLFISNWNDFSYTNLYMVKYPDLAYGIYAFRENSKYNDNWPIYYAGVLMSFAPILILFICFQNTIMEKIYLGGLKG